MLIGSIAAALCPGDHLCHWDQCCTSVAARLCPCQRLSVTVLEQLTANTTLWLLVGNRCWSGRILLLYCSSKQSNKCIYCKVAVPRDFQAILYASSFNCTIFIMVRCATRMTALVNIFLSLLECCLEVFVTFLCVWYKCKSLVSRHQSHPSVQQGSKALRAACSPPAGKPRCLEGLHIKDGWISLVFVNALELRPYGVLIMFVNFSWQLFG